MTEIAPQGPQIDAGAENVINQAIGALLQIFPGWRASVRSQEELDGYKKQMTKALIEANVTSVELLQVGISQARRETSDFLPSTGKFVSWCLSGQKPKPKPQPALPMLSTELSLEQRQAASKRLKQILGE